MGLIGRWAEAAGLAAPHPKFAGAAELADFADRRASFLAQHCVVEFCRVRAGIYWQKLFEEADFQDRLSLSCWESYAPSLVMVLEMIDANLRPHAGLNQRLLPAKLVRLGLDILSRYPQPAKAQENLLERQSALVKAEMAKLTGAAARPVREMAEPMARLIYEGLPLHKNIVRHDYDYIFNHLRMNLLRANEDLLAQADLASIASEVLAQA